MSDLQARAKAKFRRLQRARRDPRFLRAIGRLVEAGLLSTNAEIQGHTDPVSLDDLLWAGRHEPRVLELLPAIIVKKPSLVKKPLELPPDLREVVRAIRRGRGQPEFRGVPAEQYLPWVTRIGQRGRTPSLLRSFRLHAEDLARLRHLREALPAKSETEVIRLALQALERLVSTGQS